MAKKKKKGKKIPHQIKVNKMQIYHKDTGLTEEEVNAWSFLFQGQA